MFNFLKKKQNKNIKDWELQLLKSIVKRLPPKYEFLTNQISFEFILGSVPNDLLKDGWKRILCDENLYNSFKNNKINYRLIGIKVFDLKTNSNKDIELDLYEGVIIGYRITESNCEFDLNRIDIRNLYERSYENKDREALCLILGTIPQKIVPLFELENTFKISIHEGDFYVIKNLEDGNYVAIDNSSAVYGLIHDPFEVEKIFNNKEDFFKALELETFDMDAYYNKKMF